MAAAVGSRLKCVHAFEAENADEVRMCVHVCREWVCVCMCVYVCVCVCVCMCV